MFSAFAVSLVVTACLLAIGYARDLSRWLNNSHSGRSTQEIAKMTNGPTAEEWARIRSEAVSRHTSILQFAKYWYDLNPIEPTPTSVNAEVVASLLKFNVQIAVTYNRQDRGPSLCGPQPVHVAIGSYGEKGAGECIGGFGNTFEEAFCKAVSNALRESN